MDVTPRPRGDELGGQRGDDPDPHEQHEIDERDDLPIAAPGPGAAFDLRRHRWFGVNIISGRYPSPRTTRIARWSRPRCRRGTHRARLSLSRFPQLECPVTARSTDDLRAKIREVPDFPSRGSSSTTSPPSCGRRCVPEVIDRMAEAVKGERIDLVVGMESRGFIFAAPMAYRLGAGFVPVRKLGKLPAETIEVEYELEYGTATLEIHSRRDQARAARADRRRPARHRRDGDRHDRAGAPAGRRDRRALVHGRAGRARAGASKLGEFAIHTLLDVLRRRGRWRSPHPPELRARVGHRPRRDRGLPAHGPAVRRLRAGRPRRPEPRGRCAWAMAHDDAGRATALAMHHDGLVPQPLFLMGDAGRLPRHPRPRHQAARRVLPGDRAATRPRVRDLYELDGRWPCCGWSSTRRRSRRSPVRPIRLSAGRHRRSQSALPARLPRGLPAVAWWRTASITASACAAAW